jgi:hypothetical protein
MSQQRPNGAQNILQGLPLHQLDLQATAARLRNEVMAEGGRAFPGQLQDGQVAIFFPGMTLKAYYAGEAMKGLLAADSEFKNSEMQIAQSAVKHANALLAALADDAKRQIEKAKGSAELARPDITA